MLYAALQMELSTELDLNLIKMYIDDVLLW